MDLALATRTKDQMLKKQRAKSYKIAPYLQITSFSMVAAMLHIMAKLNVILGSECVNS